MAAKSFSPAVSKILSEIGFPNVHRDWEIVRIEDLLGEDRGISVGVMYPGEHDPNGVPLIKVGDLAGNFINPKPAFRITLDKHFEYRRSELKGGELLVSLVGDIGRCALVPPSMAGWNAARAVAVLRFKNSPDAVFVRACLMSRHFQNLMRAWATTTVQATLNLKEVRQIPLPWPPAECRHTIAHILKTLDDKIELNRRRNQTLEAMARALFQDWFVDFGPVRAKMEGREPYLHADFWQLFPHRLDAEGKPEGWVHGRLDDVLILQRGFDLPAADRSHGKYPVMAASGINGFHDKFMVKGPGVTTGRSGVLGQVFFVQGDFWPLNTSLWIKEFRKVSPAFAFHLLCGLDFKVFNSGSAVPTLNRNHVHNLPVVIPPVQFVDAFDRHVVPLLEAQYVNEDESKRLAELRDTLLPKLISGELRVRDAQRYIEAHTG